MKAQFVYENLDFERGMDPKTAMDIGISNKITPLKFNRAVAYIIDGMTELEDYMDSSPEEEGFSSLSTKDISEIKRLARYLDQKIRIGDTYDDYQFYDEDEMDDMINNLSGPYIYDYNKSETSFTPIYSDFIFPELDLIKPEDFAY